MLGAVGCYGCLARRWNIGAHPYPSVRIWAPWNLTMGEGSCLGDHVDCYAVDRVTLEPYATVSQYTFPLYGEP